MNEERAMKPTPTVSPVKGRHRAERIFAVLDRYAAWLSALLLFLYFISGFGMTKPELVRPWTLGLMTWRVAYDMHNILHVPLMIVFTLHTFTGLRRVMLRRTKRRALTASIAVVLGLAVLAYLLILAFVPGGL